MSQTDTKREPVILRAEDQLLDIPNRTIVEILIENARDRADHPFIEFIPRSDGRDGEPVRITYAQFERRVRAMAAKLAEHGAGRGDTVAILMENSPEWLTIFFAVLGLGGRVVPVNYDFTAEEAEYYVKHAEVRLLVCDDAHRAVADEVAGRCPDLHRVLSIDDDPPRDEDADRVEGFGVEIDPEEIALIMYTSGTSTGRPKGVMMTHRNLYIGPAEFSRVLGVVPEDRILFVTPLFHANALQYACLSALIHGATAQMVQRFSASRFWSDVERLKPSVLWTMGGIVAILMSQPETEEEIAARRHLRVMFGAGIANQFEQALQRITGVLMDCYGLTESAGGTYTPIDGSHVIDMESPAVGLPLRHTEIGIMDDDDNLLGYDEVGEIVFHDLGGNIMAGYLSDDEAQADAVRDGWFHTGDLGKVSSETGFLHFVDRKKDIVRRGGENISSQEIEGIAREHPAIGDCAVVPAPDRVLGEIVKAYVIPSEGEVDVEDLLEFMRQRLAKQKVPEIVEVRSELPRTQTGKIEKFALRRETREQSQDEWRPM